MRLRTHISCIITLSKSTSASTGLVAQSVAHSPLNWVVREDLGSNPATAAIAAVAAAGSLSKN